MEVFVPDLARFDRDRAHERHPRHAGRGRARPLAPRPHDPARGLAARPARNDGVRLFPVSLRYAWPAELDLMAQLAGRGCASASATGPARRSGVTAKATLGLRAPGLLSAGGTACAPRHVEPACGSPCSAGRSPPSPSRSPRPSLRPRRSRCDRCRPRRAGCPGPSSWTALRAPRRAARRHDGRAAARAGSAPLPRIRRRPGRRPRRARATRRAPARGQGGVAIARPLPPLAPRRRVLDGGDVRGPRRRAAWPSSSRAGPGRRRTMTSALYVAPLDGRERLVARGSASSPGRRTACSPTRSPADGWSCACEAPRGQLAARPLRLRTRVWTWDESAGEIVAFTRRERVARSDGVHVRRLRSLASLGFRPDAVALYPLPGRRLQSPTSGARVVLGPDGAVLASLRLPRGWLPAWPSSPPTGNRPGDRRRAQRVPAGPLAPRGALPAGRRGARRGGSRRTPGRSAAAAAPRSAGPAHGSWWRATAATRSRSTRRAAGRARSDAARGRRAHAAAPGADGVAAPPAARAALGVSARSGAGR